MSQKDYVSATRTIARRLADYDIDKPGFVQAKSLMLNTFEEFFEADNVKFDDRKFRRVVDKELMELLNVRGVPTTDIRRYGL